MADYYALLTAVGVADVADAIADGSPIALVDMAVGDANGMIYNPTGAETDLIRERQRATIEGVERDPSDPNLLHITAIFPADEGGFTIREAGLYNAEGDLWAIARYPSSYKPTIAEGASYDLKITISVKVAATATVTIAEMSGDFYASRDWVRGSIDYYAVSSATMLAPPAEPAGPAKYIVPAGATGAWAGYSGKVACWRGNIEGWQFVTPADGSQAGAADTGLRWLRVLGAWVVERAVRPVTAAGAANAWTGSAGLKTLVDGFEVTVLFDTTNTVKGPTFNLDALGAKPLVLDADAATGLAPGELPIVARLTYRVAGGGKWVVSSPSRGAGFGGVKVVASAATVDLGAQGSHLVEITGGMAVTSFGASADVGAALYIVTFTAALTLTHNAASLALPRNTNIVTTAGDTAFMRYLGGGNWRCIGYLRADGTSLFGGSTGAPGGYGASTDVASAATVDLGLIASHLARVTGTTSISSFGSSADTAFPVYTVRFTNTLTLVHNATSLILPAQGASITTASGDVAAFEYLGGGNWMCIGYLRASGLPVVSPTYVIPPYGGYGAISDLTAAATTNLGAVASHYVNITGATTILSFGSTATVSAPSYRVRFAGVLTLTHNATSLQLPNGQTIVTAAGDYAEFEYLGSGNWRCVRYDRTNGQPIGGAAISTLLLLQTWTWSANTQQFAFSGIPATGGRLMLEVIGITVTGSCNAQVNISSNGGTNSAAWGGTSGLDNTSVLNAALEINGYTLSRATLNGARNQSSISIYPNIVLGASSALNGMLALSAPVNYLAVTLTWVTGTPYINGGSAKLWIGS